MARQVYQGSRAVQAELGQTRKQVVAPCQPVLPVLPVRLYVSNHILTRIQAPPLPSKSRDCHPDLARLSNQMGDLSLLGAGNQ